MTKEQVKEAQSKHADKTLHHNCKLQTFQFSAVAVGQYAAESISNSMNVIIPCIVNFHEIKKGVELRIETEQKEAAPTKRNEGNWKDDAKKLAKHPKPSLAASGAPKIGSSGAVEIG